MTMSPLLIRLVDQEFDACHKDLAFVQQILIVFSLATPIIAFFLPATHKVQASSDITRRFEETMTSHVDLCTRSGLGSISPSLNFSVELHSLINSFVT